ncbi:hypothetical protein KC19_VG138300 [Ceratodon purpureus]|uniref:Uncharacterized protein n=1 Tax=Ceratodon purpureus TaxID=3225 RepID=A0A8T0HQB0_CERPU|nr:hypothetical protein KC19_VG138300 [Ceratodon purpureus]
MADRKGAGTTSKKLENKKPVTITEIKKPVPIDGPTSKKAFRKVEEEQRARLAKQRKAEEEWLQRIIEKEEDRRKRIQKIISKEEQKSAERANADSKGADDARRNLIKSLEAEQRQMRAEQMKRVKAIHRTQMLDRIVEETECATSRKQGILASRFLIRTSKIPIRRIYVAASLDQL